MLSEVRSTVIAASQQDSEGTAPASQPRQKRLRRGQAVRHKTVAWGEQGWSLWHDCNNLPFSLFGCSLTSSICHTKRYVPILATPRLIHTLFYARQADVLLTLRCGAKALASLGYVRGVIVALKRNSMCTKYPIVSSNEARWGPSSCGPPFKAILYPILP